MSNTKISALISRALAVTALLAVTVHANRVGNRVSSGKRWLPHNTHPNVLEEKIRTVFGAIMVNAPKVRCPRSLRD